MQDLRKPPIGTKPYWISASKRISELCEAIKRYTDYSAARSTDLIKLWAEEIVMQCEIIEKMRENE